MLVLLFWETLASVNTLYAAWWLRSCDEISIHSTCSFEEMMLQICRSVNEAFTILSSTHCIFCVCMTSMWRVVKREGMKQKHFICFLQCCVLENVAIYASHCGEVSGHLVISCCCFYLWPWLTQDNSQSAGWTHWQSHRGASGVATVQKKVRIEASR